LQTRILFGFRFGGIEVTGIGPAIEEQTDFSACMT
jgi:hypothetical protein